MIKTNLTSLPLLFAFFFLLFDSLSEKFLILSVSYHWQSHDYRLPMAYRYISVFSVLEVPFSLSSLPPQTMHASLRLFSLFFIQRRHITIAQNDFPFRFSLLTLIAIQLYVYPFFIRSFMDRNSWLKWRDASDECDF